MLDVEIIDFSLQVQTDFQHPRIKSDADAVGITRQIAEGFGEVIDVHEVALVSTDDLFGYTLTLPMFKGAGDVIVGPQTVSITFRTGKNRQALEFIIQSICKISTITVNRAVRLNRISFTAVARFKDPANYEEFMKRFQVPDKGVTAGGTICYASAGPVPGEARLSIEKALGYEHSIFISAMVTTSEAVQSDLFTKLSHRLTELMEMHGLNLRLPA